MLAIVLTQSWFDEHLLPSFYLMRRWYVFIESSSRVALALLGVFLLLVVRPRIGRLAAERPSAVLAAAIAAVLAVGAGQLALSWLHPSTQWLLASVEPLRRPDSRLGWTFIPSREGHKTVGGRTISFAFDAFGYGATPLILVPQFDPEDNVERMLRRRILDDAGLPYLFVEFDDGWRIPGDLHPNALTARRIASAIVDRLRAMPPSGLHE